MLNVIGRNEQNKRKIRIVGVEIEIVSRYSPYLPRGKMSFIVEFLKAIIWQESAMFGLMKVSVLGLLVTVHIY